MKTSKALQIAINTLNYPASLKAFTLLFFPAQKQAPDCGGFRMEHSGGCGASGPGEGGRGAGGGGEGRKSLRVPRNIQPSWLAGDRAGNCTGLCLQKRILLWSAGAGDFLSSWGRFSLPIEMGREKCQGCNGCLRTPSFLELSVAWGFSGFLQENNCIDSKRREQFVEGCKFPESNSL